MKSHDSTEALRQIAEWADAYPPTKTADPTARRLGTSQVP
jgi:hypothetical protein